MTKPEPPYTAPSKVVDALRTEGYALIKPADVAEAVGFLCLPSSASITGQSIMVDGGEIL